MTSQGPITLPKETRVRLGLRKGDRVRIKVVDDGRVRLLPARRRPRWRNPGAARQVWRTVSWRAGFEPLEA